MHDLLAISSVSMLKETDKVTQPSYAIAGYAWLTQSLIWLVLANDQANPAFVCRTVLLKEVVGISLCRRLRVWIVQKILDTKQELLDGDGRSPILLLVQN
jgi:hypothetical protein